MKYTKILSILLIVCILTTVIAACPISFSAATETHTITFDVQGIGETPDPITVNDGDCFLYMREHGANNPTADGYVFHCWVTSMDFYPDEIEMSNTVFYDETPIYEDMTLYAVWYKLIDCVEIEAEHPVPGEVIGTDRYETPDFSLEFQSPRPTVWAVSEGVRIQDNFWSSIGPDTFWLEDADDRESIFKGTFEDGKEYGVFAGVEPLFGYEFTDTVTIIVNGEVTQREHTADYNFCVVSAPIICKAPTAEERLLGDVDGDGDVMITDAVYLQRKIAQIDIPFTFSAAASDTDSDRQITPMDATIIQRWLSHLKTNENIGEPIK